jgi:predicted acyl esterase
MTFFLTSGGKANTAAGDGALAEAPPATDNSDKFDYDPMNPVPSYGGNVCCTGTAVAGGEGVQGDVAADEYQQLLRGGPSDSPGSFQQQLPSL